MLKRHLRLKDKRAFNNIYRRGRRAAAADMLVYCAPNHLGHNRLAVVVSTKISKKATRRNRIRRRLQGLIKSYWSRLPKGFDFLVVVKSDIAQQPASRLEQQLAGALKQLRML